MARPHAASGTRHLALATEDARAFAALRGSLIAEAVRRRHAVTCFAPSFDADTRVALERLGADCRPIAVAAQGYNPFAGYRLKSDLTQALRTLAPTTLAITDIAVLPLFAAAAERARVPHLVAMLEDFPTDADKTLRKAFDVATSIVLSTPDAERRAVASGWLLAATPIEIIPSAGLDPTAVPVQPLPPSHDGFAFLLVTAATDNAAHTTFTAAAEHMRQHFPTARFLISTDTTNAAIARAHIVVHTGTTDGLVPGLLTGLATGRPLITTNVAGARDTVDERVNGCRVPPGDTAALAEAMASFLRHPDQLPAMARASRSKAERRYDARTIDAATLAALGLGESFAAAA